MRMPMMSTPMKLTRCPYILPEPLHVARTHVWKIRRREACRTNAERPLHYGQLIRAVSCWSLTIRRYGLRLLLGAASINSRKTANKDISIFMVDVPAPFSRLGVIAEDSSCFRQTSRFAHSSSSCWGLVTNPLEILDKSNHHLIVLHRAGGDRSAAGRGRRHQNEALP